MVTEWPLQCLHYHSAQIFKVRLKKTPNRRLFQLYYYLSYKLHSSFKPGWIFCRFRLCPSNDILKINLKKILVLGPLLRDRGSLGTKQTQVKSNANRCWRIKLVNHIQPQLSRLCPDSWTPNSQNADGAPSSLGFQRYVFVCGSQWSPVVTRFLHQIECFVVVLIHI